VSRPANVSDIPTANSTLPSISENGRYVAFTSRADNLVATDTNDQVDVFVFDSETEDMRIVTRSTEGIQSNGTQAGPPSISADGRFITYSSSATNLVSLEFDPTVDNYNVFLHDSLASETRLLSRAYDGSPVSYGASASPRLTPDGNYIAFTSSAVDLFPQERDPVYDIFVTPNPFK